MNTITIKEAAEKLGIDNGRLYQALRVGELPGKHEPNGKWALDEAKVFTWADLAMTMVNELLVYQQKLDEETEK